MRPKEYSVDEVFNNTQIGLVFEFYSSKNTKFISEDLSKPLAKAVVVTGDEKIAPTWSTAILLKEYNGKKPRYQLKVAQQDYKSLGPGMMGVLEWVKKNASLDYSTKLSVDLSFKNRYLQTLTSIGDMNIGKMILKIDENFIYNKFPTMEESPFSMSVKKIVPYDRFINISNPLTALNNGFQLPIAEYYGIDFTEQPMGKLRFNYIGGPQYAAKPHEVNETIKYYILSTYQVLNTDGYTVDMKHELDKLTEAYSNIRRAYFEPEFFLSEYSGIKLSVDLRNEVQIIKSYWDKIREPLLKLVLESDILNAYFNLDTETGKFEIKDSDFSGVKIKDMNLINCTVNGLVENCSMWRTRLENSRVYNSVLVSGCNVKTSLLEEVRADRSNTIEKSYIINKGEIINCEVNESIIKNAGIGSQAKLDEECTIVEDRVKETPAPAEGVKVEEIRDYKWLKDMRQGEDKGFANEYKIKY